MSEYLRSIVALITTAACALLIASSVCAQDGGNADDVYIYGSVRDYASDKPKPDAAVLVSAEGVQTWSVQMDSLGKYELNLDFDHDYHLRYEAPGCVAKYVEIDTRNVPMNAREGGYGMNVNMTLFPFIDGVDLSFLRDPIGIARYVPADTQITWDLALTEKVKERVRIAMAIADSVKAVKALPADEVHHEGSTERKRWRMYGTITGVVMALIAMALLVVWLIRKAR